MDPGFDSSAQILAWALILGYAQQLFTRLIDARAEQLLAEAGQALDDNSRDNELAPAALESAVKSALAVSMSTPRLVTYRGSLWLRLETSDGASVDTDARGHFLTHRGKSYRLRATVARSPVPADRQAPIDIRDGDPADRVPFTLRLVGAGGSQGTGEHTLEVVADGAATVVLPLILNATERDTTVWVRLAQKGRIIQLVELILTEASGEQ